ncbi:hypothetical protein PHMEG_00010668 [Phytophthora megakarya]|uniref:Integrase zinc-binding domain-containing protein n=1 Tax=Phytophthora megakarya TaxID=4795 RepID=A0A225WD73_9STRA|nr:hypothetical protein PHMEG_00010668 [Phytophthora megakarya]
MRNFFVSDARDILYRLAQSTKERPRDMESELRLFIPTSLREDLLHFAHEYYQGGHQGFKRTYEKLQTGFYWTNCASGKGRLPNPGPSPRNIEPTYRFEVPSMDFVTHLPKSEQRKHFLALFQDTFFWICDV